MGKIIYLPCVFEKKDNIKALKILINQYIKSDKNFVINKIKIEQNIN